MGWAVDWAGLVFANRDRSRSKMHGWRSPRYRYADVVRLEGTETRARAGGSRARAVRGASVCVCV